MARWESSGNTRMKPLQGMIWLYIKWRLCLNFDNFFFQGLCQLGISMLHGSTFKIGCLWIWLELRWCRWCWIWKIYFMSAFFYSLPSFLCLTVISSVMIEVLNKDKIELKVSRQIKRDLKVMVRKFWFSLLHVVSKLKTSWLYFIHPTAVRARYRRAAPGNLLDSLSFYLPIPGFNDACK